MRGVFVSRNFVVQQFGSKGNRAMARFEIYEFRFVIRQLFAILYCFFHSTSYENRNSYVLTSVVLKYQ